MDNPEIKSGNFEKRLASLELRMSFLESALNEGRIREEIPGDYSFIHSGQADLKKMHDGESRGIESAIGRIGLAWLGMTVLLFGIIFLTEYLSSKGNKLLSPVIGYISGAVIYFIARSLRKSNPGLYMMFGITGLIMAFYITMRLHFFSVSPLIASKVPVLIMLCMIVTYAVCLSLMRNMQGYGFLALIFCYFTAILSDSTHIMLPLATIASAGSVYYFQKNRWKPILFFSVILSYTVFFLWMFSNPPMNQTLQLLAMHGGGYLYLFAMGGCFSSLPLFRDKEKLTDDFIIGMVIFHGVLFTMLLASVTLNYFRTGYVPLYTAVTVACLIYSVILKEKTSWNFPSAFFALYGFMAMSIALYGLVGLPDVYLLLSVQSLVVVSIALWFRNRLIIIMNSMLFLLILLIYMIASKSVNGINFSFALVALLSARIINWKRERLEIKTDLMRNLYLIIGFFMVMFALHHAVPKQFVALSWTIAALMYFGLSLLLRNVKYRYMALGTMISAAIYLFIVDLARIEVIYRVLALLFLAAVSIGISIYYTNRIKKTE